MPVLSLLVVAYGFLGPYLPEPLKSQSLPLDQTISNLSISFEGGVYAFLHISANFLFLFILFGGVLNATGAINFFITIGRMVMNKVRGGAAMMAVVASAGVGSVTGSAAANVARDRHLHHPAHEERRLQAGRGRRHRGRGLQWRPDHAPPSWA